MKRLILFISLILGACSDYNEERTLIQVNATVLNRNIIFSNRGTPYYQIYIFDGIESKWYDTDEKMYRKLRPRDTIASYVLTITKKISKE